MTLNEVYKDRETIFQKVISVLEENAEQNESFKMFIKTSTLTNKSKEIVAIEHMLIRMVLVHILLTIITPFAIMSIIAKFVNITFIGKLIPIFVINVLFILYAVTMYKLAIQQGIYNSGKAEYKKKDRENDLKSMISMEKESIDTTEKITKSLDFSIVSWNDIIVKLYLGMTTREVFEMIITTTKIDIITTILIKCNELLVNAGDYALNTFKTVPEESKFIEFLIEKFNETFIKSIYDNIKYDSKIDNMIVMYIFSKVLFHSKLIEDNKYEIMYSLTDYPAEEVDEKHKLSMLKDIASEYISYQVLKYGLEKEEKEKLLR